MAAPPRCNPLARGIVTQVERLQNRHRDALVDLLDQERIVNLFLLGVLDAFEIDKLSWFGSFDHGELTDVVMLIPGRLCVPWCPNSREAAKIGAFMAGQALPAMFVGPRLATDRLWSTWCQGAVYDRWYDQRLYTCERIPEGPAEPGFRPAQIGDWAQVAENGRWMELEDLGVDPSRHDRPGYDQSVKDRIRAGNTWVIEERGQIVFQINLGAKAPTGIQVGGTWVPPHLRGQGWATRGMRALLQRVLPRHSLVTLHVNEANRPAVKVYEKAGFVARDAFRLITVV
jgi:RimJ/RimL family protein N-acetyltransferase